MNSNLRRLAIGCVWVVSVAGVVPIAQSQSVQSTSPSSQPDPYKGAVLDPNFPLAGINTGQGIRSHVIYVSYAYGQLIPMITLISRRNQAGVVNRMKLWSSYLGYNDEGSWVTDGTDGKIYVWNLQTQSLTFKYNISNEIPKDVLASLKMPHMQGDAAIESHSQSAQQAKPKSPAARTDSSRAMLGDPTSGLAALKAAALQNRQGQGSQPAVAGAGFNGSQAKVEAGVLTFTLANGATASYPVVRPKSAANNPEAMVDTTGSWIAMEEGGKGILFTVQGDRSVTGKEMPAQLIQMLAR